MVGSLARLDVGSDEQTASLRPHPGGFGFGVPRGTPLAFKGGMLYIIWLSRYVSLRVAVHEKVVTFSDFHIFE